MANNDMTIAEQLKRAADALEDIDCRREDTAAAGQAAPQSSPAPAGSLSAELVRTDGLLRYGAG